MSAPQQLSVDANGLTFGALAWGETDAPLALLLHGYPDSAWTWRHLGPFLAERGWRAVAPFLRGYAPTGLAPDDRYFLADLVADVLTLHEALGGDERAALVGHDWGSAITWGVTEQAPTRFAHHVAMSIPPGPALLRPFGSLRTLGVGARQLAMSWYFVYNQLPVEGRLDKAIPAHWRAWSPGYDASEDLPHVFAALDPPGHRRAALRYYRDNLVRGVRSTLSGRPGAPALYLHGEQDGCMQAEVGALAAPHLPAGSRFERLPGVGHFLQLEDPERVNTLIGDWLGRGG